MKLTNTTSFLVTICGYQADNTSGAQMYIRGGCSYHSLDDILQPPAEEIINNIRDE